jgi:hypothetical protein
LGVGVTSGAILWDLLHENAFRVATSLYIIAFLVFVFGLRESSASVKKLR